MLETPDDLARLQGLLDASHGRATEHLRSIIREERVLTAAHVAGLLTGMKVVSVATVTAQGAPRISAMDGHFLHGRWTVSTDGGAAKARHMMARPAVSIAHVDGEEFAVFSHGRVERMRPPDPDWTQTLDHWTAFYGASPLSWGEDIHIFRYHPHWMVAYAANRSELLASRGGAS